MASSRQKPARSAPSSSADFGAASGCSSPLPEQTHNFNAIISDLEDICSLARQAALILLRDIGHAGSPPPLGSLAGCAWFGEVCPIRFAWVSSLLFERAPPCPLCLLQEAKRRQLISLCRWFDIGYSRSFASASALGHFVVRCALAAS